MTPTSAPCEQTSSEPRVARFSRDNAFRVLSLPADAELKQIYRQQQRLLLGLELGERDGTKECDLLPLTYVSKQEILEAVHFLERPADRLIEELFWVHKTDGRGDLIDGRLDNVLGALRGAAISNTRPGAVARHNLAVLQSILGRESAGNGRFDHWIEALKIWKRLIDNDFFWTFMEDRAIRGNCDIHDAGMMRGAVCRQLSSTLSEELARAIKSRELTAVAALARITMEHRSWLRLDAALQGVGEQAIKDGFASLGAILDRLSGITQQDNKVNIQKSLVEREKELRGATGKYGAVVRSLAELADADSWDDAVASSYQKLSLAYFNWLDDPYQTIRLIARAREFAGDPRLLQSMERDWQRVQRVILCREADALMQTGDFATAEHKLAAALAISSEEQKHEIQATQDRCRWARVLCGVDTSKKNPTLSTLNVVGAMFYGKRDYDPGTRSYVTNHWLTFLLLPIYPLGAYRVTDVDSGSYYIHGRVPLSNLLKKTRWVIAVSIIVLVLVALMGRGTSRGIGGATSTGTVAPPESADATERFPAIFAGTQHSASDNIEEEQRALGALGQSLEERKKKLDIEAASMTRQEGYLAGVGSSYEGEWAPDGGQQVYEALFADYNSRVMKYNRKLAALKADFAAYTERVNSFNARIQLFNRFR
jgi:hypothetical protein